MTTTRPGRWRGGLPEPARRAFCSLFRVGEYTLADGTRIRFAGIDGGPGETAYVIDPVDADENPGAWPCVRMQKPADAYEEYRLAQVHANRVAGRMEWPWYRGQFEGRPAYIVGSGPSAIAARTAIPPAHRRRGLVFAINTAAALFPADHDFWCCADALWPDGYDDWQARLLAEWARHDHEGAVGIFNAYANARSVEQFFELGGSDAGFYLCWNANAYREAASAAGKDLPAFVTGLQGVVEVVHAAAWLGCSPIVLFGVDESRPGGAPMHSVGAVGWRSGTVLDAPRWIAHPGLDGPTETCPAMLLTAQVLAAEAAFLWDAGIPVFNASSGLDLLFALGIEPAEAVALCESGEVGLAEAVRMAPSLGRRAEVYGGEVTR